jgi:hypothetical protein
MATHRPSRHARATTLREESPEIQALSPPIQTQELPPTVAVPRPRARRRGQNVAESQLQSQLAGPTVVAAQEQPKQQQSQQQPVAIPSQNEPSNGVNGSVSSPVKANSQQVEPESSPLQEPLPRRARIRRSLMPPDHSGRLVIRAGVMEERVKMILTVAQDAVLTSMQFELDDMGEGTGTWAYLTKVWDVLDCKSQPVIWQSSLPYSFKGFETPQLIKHTSSTSSGPLYSCHRRLLRRICCLTELDMSTCSTRFPL